MTGSAGQLTFKRVGGKTIVSEKITATTNTRTTAQQKHRMKWPNLINMYSGVSPFLNCAFENKPQGLSDYNMFVKVNFAGSNVYLTKGEAAAKSCVAAPYQITMGSLDSIEWTGEAGSSVTDITIGPLVIDDATTIAAFSHAVVSNNVHYDYGDQISFICVVQGVNAVSGHPQCWFYGECVVLDKSSQAKLRACVSAAGFTVKNGKLGCMLDDEFQGAYAWVHSRKQNGATKVSSQVMTVKNDLFVSYSDDAAYQRAVATYGGETGNFLTPDASSEGGPIPPLSKKQGPPLTSSGPVYFDTLDAKE